MQAGAQSRLELLRKQAAAELDENITNKLLDRAPFMYGQTFLNCAWIEQAWRRLRETYINRLQTREVETEEYLFSFMATYAAEGGAAAQ